MSLKTFFFNEIVYKNVKSWQIQGKSFPTENREEFHLKTGNKSLIIDTLFSVFHNFSQRISSFSSGWIYFPLGWRALLAKICALGLKSKSWDCWFERNQNDNLTMLISKNVQSIYLEVLCFTFTFYNLF